MWIVKVKYRTGEGLFDFFFLLSKYSYNIKQKIHHWCRMVLIYILSFDFINFVKEFFKRLELQSKLKETSL